MTLEEAKILVYGYIKDDPAYAEAVALLIAVDSAMPNMTAGCHCDRGDTVSHDFEVNDFIKDGDWHVLDLSGIVPEGVSFIYLRFGFNSSNTGNMFIRQNGNTNSINVIRASGGGSAGPAHGSDWVACGADRKIEYMFNTVSYSMIVLTVRGWFKQ